MVSTSRFGRSPGNETGTRGVLVLLAADGGGRRDGGVYTRPSGDG